MKAMVAYFSASGVTEKLAQRLSAVISADLYEIVPAVRYTEADLDWQNKQSRSSVEMADDASRPAVAGKIEKIGEYDKIYVGFPIWWYRAPTIINTFLEQYDLAGKTVIPFATSGGSGMGSTNTHLEPSCKGAILKQGMRFKPSVSDEELKAWAESV